MTPIVLVDRYELKTELSRKAGRRTYRAIDKQTDLEVIVKVLLFGPEFKWADLRLFEREIEVLRSLDYPTIPKYLDSFDVEMTKAKGFGLVQTNISALSLEESVQRGRVFSESDIREIGRSLLETLIYLHRMSPPVIHRDIKPSNVLLGDRSGNFVGDVYLVDFGAVQTAVMSDRQTMTVVGTYGYMPPEQFAGRSSPGSDLYSLGATLLYLVTGKHPAEMVSEDLELEFGDIEHVSQHLEDWLTHMVQPMKSKRFGSALEALEALEKQQFQIRKLYGSKVLSSKGLTFLHKLLDRWNGAKSFRTWNCWEKQSSPSSSSLAPQPTSKPSDLYLDVKTEELDISFTPQKVLIRRINSTYKRFDIREKILAMIILCFFIPFIISFLVSISSGVYVLNDWNYYLYWPLYWPDLLLPNALLWSIPLWSISLLLIPLYSYILLNFIIKIISLATALINSDKAEIYTLNIENNRVSLTLVKNKVKFDKHIPILTISEIEVMQADSDRSSINIVANNNRYQISALEGTDPLWLAESLANWLEVPLHDRRSLE